MAYRFLLSVPTAMVDDANIAVSQADDAQVLVVRNAHGLGFEDAYADLTVAAHSLRLIATLYDWWESMGVPKPAIGLVLHSGARLALADRDRGSMVAAIRQDQPWVERTLPRIGQHARDESLAPVAARVPAAVASPSAAATTITAATQGAPMATTSPTTGSTAAPAAMTAPIERSWRTISAEERAPRAVAIRDVNHIAVRVIDLERAERFYMSFLGMDVVARGVRNLGETIDLVGPGYVWSEASATGRQADVSFLRNGPLVLAVYRLGRGARIERDVLDHISLRVDLGAFRQLKGEALMRSMETLQTTDRLIALRDPFGITWEISVDSLPELLG